MLQAILQLLRQLTWREAVFSVKSFAAATLALYIAFRLDFSQPIWSVTTVYIVAQPFGLLGFDAPLQGHVESVARAITDRDNVLATDLIANVNPTFNWVRLAQRIPVRIAIDKVPDGITLSAGMTATVVVTGPSGPVRASSQAP